MSVEVTHVVFHHIYPAADVVVPIDEAWGFYEQAQREHKAYEVVYLHVKDSTGRTWRCFGKFWMVWDIDMQVWRITRFGTGAYGDGYGPHNPHLVGRDIRSRMLSGHWLPCLV